MDSDENITFSAVPVQQVTQSKYISLIYQLNHIFIILQRLCRGDRGILSPFEWEFLLVPLFACFLGFSHSDVVCDDHTYIYGIPGYFGKLTYFGSRRRQRAASGL